MRPWAIAEDQVKVAASAGHVEVAFSRSKWPLAPVIAGAGAVTGGAGCGVPVIHFGRSVRPPCPSALPVDSPERRRTRAVEEDGLRPQTRAPAAGACAGRPVRRARTLQRAHLAWETGLHLDTVRRWRGRFAQASLPGLQGRQRCGRPASFTPLQAAEVKALAGRLPAESEVPLSPSSFPELAREAARRGIAPFISASTVRRWLAQDTLKPWQHRSWTFTTVSRQTSDLAATVALLAVVMELLRCGNGMGGRGGPVVRRWSPRSDQRGLDEFDPPSGHQLGAPRGRVRDLASPRNFPFSSG